VSGWEKTFASVRRAVVEESRGIYWVWSIETFDLGEV
jgi:hypothetical protein